MIPVGFSEISVLILKLYEYEKILLDNLDINIHIVPRLTVRWQ